MVVVLGMHRSGTSLVAGCLQRLGVDFGPRLMPPNADNPRGYFEHNDVVNLHDRLLLALNRSWDETAPFASDWFLDEERLAPYRAQLLGLLHRDFPAAPLWGLKDPRMCLLLPWWETVWPETASRPLFILVRRRPSEVAASLARREGMSAAKASLLWLRHTLEAERWTRPHDRLLVDFDEFLADETAALAPIRHVLGLPTEPESQNARLVDPALGRSAGMDPAAEVSPWIETADAALLAGAAGREEDMRNTLDQLVRQLGAAEPLLMRAVSTETTDLLRQLEASRVQARWYEAEWRKVMARIERLTARQRERESREKSRSKSPSHE